MKTDLFDFKIPDELIAQNPCNKRSDSRLLIYYKNENKIIDSYMKNITDYLDKDHFLVFNNSRVYQARFKIHKKQNNIKGEILILKIIDPYTIQLITDKSKKYPVNTEIVMPDKSLIFIKENLTNQVKTAVSKNPIFNFDYLEKYGQVPIPPYIRKSETIPSDKNRYQTIYSKNYGSSAAPTAGLHFDEIIFDNLNKNNIDYAFVSLHVGLGTFSPIYTDNIEDHKIHEEDFMIEENELNKINKAIKLNKKIIAVGTTSCRTLETACHNGYIETEKGKSSLYIYPGYNFKIINGLITNFHTPKSSLLVLVSALIGYDKLKELYDYAISQKYRFFSYGDAMMII